MGYAQLASFVGISYKAMVLLRREWEKNLEVNQGVTLKVALRGLLKDSPGGKEGRRDAKIRSMRKGNPALANGHFKRTEQCPALQGAIALIEGMKSFSKGMRNLNVFVDW